jgi:hypothetical protein
VATLLRYARAVGTSAHDRGVGRVYPYADQLLERMALGNKLIVVALPKPWAPEARLTRSGCATRRR